MRKITATVLALLAWGGHAAVLGQRCADRVRLQTFRHGDGFNIPVWKFSRGVVGFLSVMHVNADGAPMSYNKDDTGWSYLCDGAVAFDRRRCIFPPERGWQRACRATWAHVLAEGFNGPDKMCYFGFLVDGGTPRGNSKVGGP